MGLGNYFRNRDSMRKASVAADEMWRALAGTGVSFEVTHGQSADDDVVKAVMILRKRHPNVTAMFQARGVILGLDSSVKGSMSGQAHSTLEGLRYFPSNELSPEHFLAERASFAAVRSSMTEAELDAVADKKAEKDFKERSITL